MVESLGHLADPARQPELIKRYDVRTGSITYYGSTTAAEMRELCNTREPYQRLLDDLRLVCLPELMTTHGYVRSRCTISAGHSLTASTGIQKSVFSE